MAGISYNNYAITLSADDDMPSAYNFQGVAAAFLDVKVRFWLG